MNKFSTLNELLYFRETAQANQLAYTFLENGETESAQLTYGQLALQARAIAAFLQSQLATDERVLLLFPSGLDFICAFFGCLSAAVVPVPVNPPGRHQNLKRLQSIVADAQPKMILTTSSWLPTLEKWLTEQKDWHHLPCIVTERISLDLAQCWQEPNINAHSLAFLQYTSGSTGNPKGVMVSHENLIYNCKDLDLGWEHTSESVMVTWLPHFHDMGLIYGILVPLFKGFPCYLMPPMSFLQKPWRWLQAISTYRATHSGAPNFAYELCVDKISPEQCSSLDLSSWQVALNGSESVRAEVLALFSKTFEFWGFSPRAFCPGYGLAEATLKVTAVRRKSQPMFERVQSEALAQNQVVEAKEGQQNARVLVGCGQTEIDTKIIIVNPESREICLERKIGEIWVSGATVTQGYWQNQEATEKTFQAYLNTGEGPFLRTGDLGFLKDGELFVTGRIKDIIIIRGCNYYPEDIEITIQQSHPALRPTWGAAFAVEVNGEDRLVVVQEVQRGYLRQLNAGEVIKTICRSVSEQHELQPYAILLLKTGSIPKTSSGKIQRYACKAGFLKGSLTIVVDWSENLHQQVKVEAESLGQQILKQQALLSSETIQNWLVTKIAQRLKIKPTDIDISEPLVGYGLDSMTVASFSGEFELRFKCGLPPNLLYESPSIESLAQNLARSNDGVEILVSES